MLTKEVVGRVALLARLEFSEEELGEFSQQMAKIVDLVDKLSEVDTAGVDELAHPLDLHSVLRIDEQQQGLSRDSALRNSPNHDSECFLVPPVMTRKH